LPIGAPHGQDPVEPALQDRRQAEPPQRELNDHQVASFDLADLGVDFRRKATVFAGIRFLDLQLQIIRIFLSEKIVTVGHRIEAHAVQIANDDDVTGRFERPYGNVEQGAIKTLPLRVSKDDENIHVGFLGGKKCRTLPEDSENGIDRGLSERSSRHPRAMRRR
jgi:hypothetical protein